MDPTFLRIMVSTFDFQSIIGLLNKKFDTIGSTMGQFLLSWVQFCYSIWSVTFFLFPARKNKLILFIKTTIVKKREGGLLLSGYEGAKS